MNVGKIGRGKMSDYIDRQAAISTVENLSVRCEGDYDVYVDCLKQAFEELPSADVQPVRHGHWEIYVISPFDGEDVRCSECGTCGCAPYWDYCPHCGAKMK